MLITNLHNNEGGVHYYSKEYLLDWIIDENVIFVDENKHMFKIKMNIVDFISTESYVYKETESTEPYSSGNCCSCLDYDIDNYDLRFKDNMGAFNENMIICDDEKKIFKTHPCNFCKYKGINNCIFIFDIGVAHKGSYDLAIEMVDTSPIKSNKIAYCKKNDIGLIEITAKNVMRLHNDIKYLPCRVINQKQLNNCIQYLYED